VAVTSVTVPTACHVRNVGAGLKVWDEESGELHRELEGFEGTYFTALATFLSPDGQQPRLVAGSSGGDLVIYDPEAGSVLHRRRGHTHYIADLACIASSSATPQGPRVISASYDHTAEVCDGETGGLLAGWQAHEGSVTSVAVWREHHGGHDRIATVGHQRVKVWDGEAFTLLHDLDCSRERVLAFTSGGGAYHLLIGQSEKRGLQIWDPEEGRLLHEGIQKGCPFEDWHLFESAGGRQLLAITGKGIFHARHPRGVQRAFLDVWDLGEAPALGGHVRPANKQG
jgi:WD40 repeat protein